MIIYFRRRHNDSFRNSICFEVILLWNGVNLILSILKWMLQMLNHFVFTENLLNDLVIGKNGHIICCDLGRMYYGNIVYLLGKKVGDWYKNINNVLLSSWKGISEAVSGILKFQGITHFCGDHTPFIICDDDIHFSWLEINA